MSVEYNIFNEIEKILLSLSQKDVSLALNWCNSNKSKLSKTTNNIKFRLLKQNFIELVKKNLLIEAIKFARENFKEFNNYEEIQEIMILMAINPADLNSQEKYKVKIFNHYLKGNLIRQSVERPRERIQTNIFSIIQHEKYFPIGNFISEWFNELKN